MYDQATTTLVYSFLFEDVDFDFRTSDVVLIEIVL
jgi:hypothetical protein